MQETIAFSGLGTPPVVAACGLEDSLQRIEDVLRGSGPPRGQPPINTLIQVIARSFGLPQAKLPTLLASEKLDSELYRFAEAADLIVRPVAVDDAFLRAGASPLICRRVSDGALVALLRSGTRWLVHDPLLPKGPTRLTPTIRRDLELRGFQLDPCLPAKAVTQSELIRFGWRAVRFDLAAYAGMTLLAGVLLAIGPIIAGKIIDIVIPGREMGLLIDLLVMLVVLAGANVGVRMAAGLAQVRIDGIVGSMLRAAAINRAVRLPVEKRASVAPPIITLAVRAVENWHRGMWKLLLSLAASILMALPSVAVIAASAPGVALPILATFVVALALACLFAFRQQAVLSTSTGATPTSWMATAYESYFNIDTVRATGAETAMFNRWVDGFVVQQARQLAAARVGVWSTGLSAGLEAMFVLVAVAAVILSGIAMQPETAVPFVMAATAVVGAASSMVAAVGQLGMLALQKRLAQPLLSAVPDKTSHGELLTRPKGALAVVQVTFRHSPGSPAVLNDVSLQIEPGEYTGIVGASGAGKSTLLQIMLGMKTPETGSVFIDGVDITKLDMPAMRRRIGIVGQGASLFPGSLRENVTLGLVLSDAQIWEALRLAGVDRDIAAMPLALGTVIGDTNPMLSGGQVQRLLFARALAAEPKLIILDEATSALDTAAQAIITKTIRGLGISVVAVAHRLETLASCDRIYVLGDGRIVQRGSFTELAAMPGVFADALHS
jgi:ABC-type bacteriocin/lantibiotic exporter with double-glycine peptidase domain